MTPRLLLQLAHLHDREADAALPDPYALPRVQATAAQADEASHLAAIANAAFARWRALVGDDAPSGTDAAFT